MTKIYRILKKYERKIHEIACNLLQYKVPQPIIKITSDPYVSMGLNPERKIEFNPSRLKKEFTRLKFVHDFSFEEYIVYHLEEESIHYVHLNLNPAIDKFGERLELLEFENYLKGKIEDGDAFWVKHTLWKGYIEGIGKRGRAWIRDIINFPKENFDKEFESNLLSHFREMWKKTSNFVRTKKSFNEIEKKSLADAFCTISSCCSEFFGREKAKEMEKWDIEEFRRFARKGEYEFGEEDLEILEKVLDKLHFESFNEIFPILRSGFISKVRQDLKL